MTLETPKVEEIGAQEEALSGSQDEEVAITDFNMGSSSSSQYTFCQPETGTLSSFISLYVDQGGS